MQVWPADLQKKIIQIGCVQTNMTSIEKALTGVIELNPKLSVNPQIVKTIAKMANGDMSAAINILRVMPKVRDKNISHELVGKDLSDTNLFHRFGKIMYNKSNSN